VEESPGGEPELSASLYLYLGEYKPLLSKYPGSSRVVSSY
jgi:hypothetical protein